MTLDQVVEQVFYHIQCAEKILLFRIGNEYHYRVADEMTLQELVSIKKWMDNSADFIYQFEINEMSVEGVRTLIERRYGIH